ncbi:hypothetical protein B0H15DRAFT_924770 [Mycena belliarum]|uniref:MYND-type domain-containing protein n=1 Tax=Mycena belliarum TaxID=1033014 RepID=A0AAD6TX81_9AGAR|nr:hypothetical protein B0H15DRAFT_924770 [Mycena belliae]
MSQDPKGPFRKVYLPLEKLERCHACSKTPKSPTLKLCAACGERSYCSATCQKKDWPSHKVICGKTDRIDLERYYPFLACMADAFHFNMNKPLHPAMTHAIVNSPNPGSHPTGLPDGSAANLLLLGDPILPTETGTEKWWPSAMTPNVRGKLLRRIVREGYTLAVATSICLALLAEMYTTTFVSAADSPHGEIERRSRLTYKSSPIADFGVVAGSADVKNQDKLAYFSLSDMSFFRGQDPDDHYWIYFTTIRGEEILLDCAMFTFNMCIMVNAGPYLCNDLPYIDAAPAFFRERVIGRHAPDLYTERRRMSVLRNDDLNRAVAYPLDGLDMALVGFFMKTLAGRTMSRTELDLVRKCNNVNCAALAINLERRAWANWPEPPLGIEGDPEERVCDPEASDAWFEYTTKWRSKNKKGTADKDSLVVAFREFEAQRAQRND